MEQETVNQHNTLETVIGGGNPAQAEGHFKEAVRLEKNGFRVGAIEELRQAVTQGTNQEHVFRLAYLLDLVGEETEATALYEELAGAERPHVNALLNLAVIYEDKGNLSGRSEERRVGKECRSRWSPYY
mgnify:CR=1 FL=1